MFNSTESCDMYQRNEKSRTYKAHQQIKKRFGHRCVYVLIQARYFTFTII